MSDFNPYEFDIEEFLDEVRKWSKPWPVDTTVVRDIEPLILDGTVETVSKNLRKSMQFYRTIKTPFEESLKTSLEHIGRDGPYVKAEDMERQLLLKQAELLDIEKFRLCIKIIEEYTTLVYQESDMLASDANHNRHIEKLLSLYMLRADVENKTVLFSKHLKVLVEMREKLWDEYEAYNK